MDIRIARVSEGRGLPKPERAFRRVIVQAPQLEILVTRLMQTVRPVLATLYRLRRRLATASLAGLTIWLFLHVMLAANGMFVYRHKRAEYGSLQQEVRALQQENDRYSDQIKALKTDPKTIEKEAREQLHYARPGEVVYVSPLPPAAPPPGTNAASR
jgi:cell division protein FtsB